MNIILVVNHLHDWPSPWPSSVPGVKIVSARSYLMDAAYCGGTDVKVFNLCKSSRYQSRGYYVSLLAEARGHRPVPDIKAIEDLNSDELIRMLAENLDAVMQSSFAHIDSDRFELDIHFGRNADMQRRYDKISEQLFNLLRVPLVRTRFERTEGRWHLRNVRALGLIDIAPHDFQKVMQAASDCMNGHRARMREPAAQKPTLAILHSSGSAEEPSNPAAMRKFQEAAEALGMRSEIIGKDDGSRLAKFDALFIRDTTGVHHYTYQFARQAAVAGMVVMDDPDSILKCSNKVYLTELLGRHHLPTPKTLTVHRGNVAQIIPALGLPCILKQPDGAFSLGVVKVESERELESKGMELLEKSELIIAQEYLPTEFDWRIGILDRRPLFACKYYMAPNHWQIIKHEADASLREGMTEAMAVEDAPDEVVKLALEAANLVGDGFYGVDLKQRGQHCYIIEINDNPNVDAGNEDGVLQDALYREVMSVIRERIEAHKRNMVGSIA